MHKCFSVGAVAGLAFCGMLVGAVACSSSSSPGFGTGTGDDGGGNTSSGGSGGGSGSGGDTSSSGGGTSSSSGGGNTSSGGGSSSGGSSSSGSSGDAGCSLVTQYSTNSACTSCINSMCASDLASCGSSLGICIASSCMSACLQQDAGMGSCPSGFSCSTLPVGGIKGCTMGGGLPPTCDPDAGSASCSSLPGSACTTVLGFSFCVKSCM